LHGVELKIAVDDDAGSKVPPTIIATEITE
jgi:hypothetical protein